MKRREFLGAAMASGLAGCGTAGREDASNAQRPPNVVFILTDDQAPNTLGAYGNSEIQTPVSDRLCAGGAMMTRSFCTTPVCSPSRATLFTGQIPSQHGIHDWISDENEGEHAVRFLDGEATFSQTLADAGYRVGLSGKWHMGDSAVPQQGFDYWFAMPTGGSRYQDPLMYWNGEKKEYPGYTTDVVTDKAIEFIESAARDPFFCFVSYNAPHTPYQGTPQKYLDLYKDSPFKTFAGEPLNEPISHALSKANVGNRESKIYYYAMITAIDDNVGRIVRRLEDLKLSNDTLVVYLSDHGFLLEQHGLWGKGNTSWPFNMYDESMLVPAYFYHPGRIPGGQKIGAMTSFYDFAPTILDYCGAPALKSTKPLPGRSYAALLEGGEIPDWPEVVYGEYAYCRCIRTKNWKYIHRTEGFPSELYDLESDPHERRNLVDDPSFAERKAQLKDQMDEWFAGLGCADYDMWKHAKQKVLPSVERVERG